MSKSYEVVKPFELGQPGDVQAYAAGETWEPPAGWTEIDKRKHQTLANQPYPVFQWQEKKPTKDLDGKTVMRITVREVVLPVREVA